MIFYRVLDRHIVGTAQNTVFRRHSCEWILPQEVAAKHIRYNPRHLPVVTEDRREDTHLTLSILRIMRGYRVDSTLEQQAKAIFGAIL